MTTIHFIHARPRLAWKPVTRPVRTAETDWQDLDATTRQEVLLHAVRGMPHPNADVSAAAYRFALDRLNPGWLIRSAAVMIGAILVGIIANVAGSALLDFSPVPALVLSALLTATALIVGLFSIRASRGQAVEVAHANRVGLTQAEVIDRA